MSEPHWYQPGHPDLWRALRALSAFAEATLRYRFPPGVYRHGSIEEAEALRQEWQDANLARYRERLKSG
jgi:hypothetical protein